MYCRTPKGGSNGIVTREAVRYLSLIDQRKPFVPAFMPDLVPEIQRRFAREIVQRLHGSRFEAYWAGGCVRDQLLGLTPHDYDVATNATPEQVRRLFGQRRTLAVGMAFGVIVVLGPPGAGQIEVATFRNDFDYKDGRRPGRVAFSSAQEDASRRDFTINGLFYDPTADRVIDFVGGQADLAARVVRAIGNPDDRFTEDKLRMLRAVRFAATLGFALDPATLDAVTRRAAEIDVVSAERIAEEMRRMLISTNRVEAMRLLLATGLAAHVLPEIAPHTNPKRKREESNDAGTDQREETNDTRKDGQAIHGTLSQETETEATHKLSPVKMDKLSMPSDWETTLARLDRLGEATFALALAATLVDWVSPDGIQQVCRRWRLSNEVTDRAVWLVERRGCLRDARNQRWSVLQKTLVSPGIDELVQLTEVDATIEGRSADEVVYCRELLRQPRETLDPPPLVTGDDLLTHGLSAGPLFGTLLSRLRDAQLDGEIRTKAEGLAMVEGMVRDLGI